jgi:chitinase
LPLKKKDFVLGLPRGRKGSDAIWVMVDHLIKSTFFLPMKKKDFVLGLPRGRKASDAIWVMVDQLIKSTLFLPMKKKDFVDKLAKLYVREVVWGTNIDYFLSRL